MQGEAAAFETENISNHFSLAHSSCNISVKRRSVEEKEEAKVVEEKERAPVRALAKVKFLVRILILLHLHSHCRVRTMSPLERKLIKVLALAKEQMEDVKSVDRDFIKRKVVLSGNGSSRKRRDQEHIGIK